MVDIDSQINNIFLKKKKKILFFSKNKQAEECMQKL